MSHQNIVVVVDGYSVSERLLEGVMFNVLFALDEDYRVEDVLVSPKGITDAKFLQKLGSVEKHCNDVREWALSEPHNTLLEYGGEQDQLFDENSNTDLIPLVEKHRETRPEPVRVEATNMKDLLSGL
tara:strand:- start:58 stop:438 length:381 start_codon:yes stop_codon:yes gene_type:complete